MFKKIIFSALVLSITTITHADDSCEVIGHLASTEGIVEVQRADTSKWLSAKTDDSLCQGDTV